MSGDWIELQEFVDADTWERIFGNKQEQERQHPMDLAIDILQAVTQNEEFGDLFDKNLDKIDWSK